MSRAPSPKRRRLLHRPWAVATLGRAIAGLVGLVEATVRWRLEVHPETFALLQRGESAVGAFWHGRLLLIPPLWHRLQLDLGGRRAMYAIVSAHGDGELIASALNRLGVPPVRGSTGRSGARALLAARGLIRNEQASIAVAVDGPRGPSGCVQPGVLFLARETGAAVVPASGSVRPHTCGPSWDRLLIPWPFGRGVLLVGAPIHVPADADDAQLDALRQDLAGVLEALTRAADAGEGLPW